MSPLSRRRAATARWVLLATLFWLTLAQAQDDGELLLLELCLDEGCLGLVLVLVEGDTLWLDAESAATIGLALPPDGPRRRVRERDFVAVADLPEIAEARFDRARLRLDLRRRPETLPLQERRLVRLRQPADSSDAVSYPTTLRLDYQAGAGDLGPDDLFLDAALGRRHLALRSTLAWDEEEAWRRGLTRLEFDQPENLRRWIAGDQFATSPELLAGSALLGGVGVARAFEQDPFLVTFPQPYLAGVLDVPGTVEIYSNGVLVGRVNLAAGPFSLQEIGLPTGRSDLEVVFRDSFGNRRQLQSQAFYAGGGLLADGLSDYALRVGFPRRSTLGDGYDGDPAVQGWYRRGLSERFTLGGAFEAESAGAAGYASLAASSRIGEFSLSTAWAEADGLPGGAAAALGYSYQRRGFGLGAGWRWRERGFRALGERLEAAREQRSDVFLSVSQTFDNSVFVRANASRDDTGIGPVARNYGLDLGYRSGAAVQVQLSLQRREFGRDDDTVLLFNLALAFDGARGRWRPTSASLAADWREGGEVGGAVDVRRFRPLGEGLGYDLSLREGGGPGSGFGRVEYQGRHGRYAVLADRVEGQGQRGRVETSGSVAIIGGRASFAPPTSTGFALVRVPGAEGLDVRRENQPVGRTDARGDLLVRDLLPFYPNRIGIDADSIALGFRHGELERRVEIPANAGALVRFDVRPLRAVHGTLALEPMPATAQVAWSSREGEVDYRLGSAGRFYQEDLPAGDTRWRVVANGHTYTCELVVPEEPGLHDLGQVPCRLQSERASEH